MKAMGLKARIYIYAVMLVGAVTVAIATVTGSRWIANNLALAVGIAVGAFLAEWFAIHFAFGKESWSFSVVEIAIAFGILTVPTSPLIVAAALGLGLAQIPMKRAPIKGFYNVAMYSIAVAGSAEVFALLQPLTDSDLERWLACLAAMAVFYSVNQVMLGVVVALVQGQKVVDLLKAGGPILAAVWLGNTVLGMLAQHLASTQPVAVFLFGIPVLLSYGAYRGWIGSKAESKKMRSLYEVGASLMTSLGSEVGITSFLERTSEMFRSDGAQIVTYDGPGILKVFDHEGDVQNLEVPKLISNAPNAIEGYVASKSWGSHITVPLASEIGITGALIVHGYHGPGGVEHFPKNDSNLLQLLANELSIALSNVALFNSISEERSKLADIVEHTSDGIYQVSTDRRIMTWNPAMETITGFSAVEAVGQMCFNLLRARDNKGVDMCSGDCPISAAAAHSCHQSREAEIMTKDGVARWIAYSHSPILDATGAMTSDVIVVRDVTTQRATQEMKDDFIATVSHELRTPITPIKGFLLTLLRPDLEFSRDEQEKYFRMMLRQSERLERLVEDLLDASRLESGKLTIELGVVDVTKLAEQILDGYRASEPDREFRFSSPRDTVLAKANSGRLEQVICNLVQNAIRYTPAEEPIELIVREEEGRVTVSVRDRGPGIAADEQEMVFERFYRSGHHLTREQGGTGLGLFIARKLAEGMGGDLSLESRFGHGATFTIGLMPVGVGLSSSSRL